MESFNSAGVAAGAGLNPRPKSYRPLDGRCVLGRSTTVWGGPDPRAHREAARLADRLRGLTGLPLTPGGPSAAVRMRRVRHLTETADRPESFVLRIGPAGVTIAARDDAGLQYGGRALDDLLRRDGPRWTLGAAEIADWPDVPWRGLMVDPARKFIPVPRLLRLIEDMAASRLNVLHLHLTDNEQVTVELPSMPALNRRMYHQQCCSPITPHPCAFEELARIEREYAGVYTRADLRAVVAAAAERHVRVIPEIEFPSHAMPILHARPDLLCQTGTSPLSGSGKRPSESIVCIGNPATYRFYETLIAEIAPLFPAPYVHIGADEIDCPIVPLAKRSWDRCSVCRAAMRRRGYATVHGLFYDAIRRLRRLLAAHGKRLMMWNDYIDIARPVPLPRDILIQFWRIADRAWPIGPIRGCSFAKFLKAGFSVVNSYYPHTYIDSAVRDARLLRWHPAAAPPAPPALRARILGGELCAWGDHPFYPRALPTGLAVFGDRAWSRAPAADPCAYARGLARHLFGPALRPDVAPVFEALGAIVPPLEAGRRVFPDGECSLPGRAQWTRRGLRALAQAVRRQARDPRTLRRDLLRELELGLEERLR